MTIRLEVNGVEYEQFTEISVTVQIDTLARQFTAKATAPDGLPLPFKGNEPCRVIVDGVAVLTGHIETVDVSYDANSHSISLRGRGKTGDLVDSSLEGKAYSADVSLKTLIEDLLDEIGLSLEVIDETDIALFNPAEDKIGIQTGENAFSYAEKLARKRQVLLTSNGDGNIVITRASDELIDVDLLNELDGPENNIKSADIKYDFTGRYNLYNVSSQLNASSRVWDGGIDLSDVSQQSSTVIDNDVREGRKVTLKAEKSSSTDQCTDRANWEANIRQTRSIVYSCTVAGHSTMNGDVWEVNKLVNVLDVFADISAQMLINSLTFAYNVSNGSTTKISLVDRTSYTLKEPGGPDPKSGRSWGDNVGNNKVSDDAE